MKVRRTITGSRCRMGLNFYTIFRCRDTPESVEKPDEPDKVLKALARPKIKKNQDKPNVYG